MASLTLKAVQAKKLSEFFAAAAQVGLPCPCVQLRQPCRMYSSIDLPQRTARNVAIHTGTSACI